MAGTNKVFKQNDMLFKAGDPADAMYIVRKGTLKVFLQKGDTEVTLATLNDGAIVGEMAFFDDQPRSASVKAAAQTEVTVITKADFEKLLKQIPAWFVAMMKSLTGRLRQTNERLQNLEAATKQGAPGSKIMAGQEYPFQIVLRVLQIVMLSFARDGNKDNPKEPFVEAAHPRKLWTDFFGERDLATFDKVIQETVKTGFYAMKGTQNPTIVFVNRGTLVNFMQFFGDLSKKFSATKPFVRPQTLTLIDALVDAAAASGYPTFAVNIGEVITKAKAKKTSPDADVWADCIPDLAVLPDFKVTGSGNDQSIKITVKDHKLIATYLKHISIYANAGLA